MSVLSGAARWLAALCVLCSCNADTVDSDAVNTDSIFMSALALAPGDGFTWVRARVYVAGDQGLPIRLVASDELMVRLGDASEEPLLWVGDGQYERRFVREQAERVELSLDRYAREEPASRAQAPLPEPFVMHLEGVEQGRARRGSALELRWGPAGQGPIQWRVAGACIQEASGSAPDSGMLELPASALSVRPAHEGQSCEVLATLERVNPGTIGGGFLSSSRFQAIQRRGVRFQSLPPPGVTPEPPAPPPR